MLVSIIAAMGRNRVIGKNSKVPWDLPDDIEFFLSRTKGHYLLMGRKTFEEPQQMLKGRKTIVLTTGKDYDAGESPVVHAVEDGIRLASVLGETELFIAGGGHVYEQSLELANRIYLTVIEHEFEGDVFFPEFSPEDWKMVSEKFHDKDQAHKYSFYFRTYERH